MATKGKRLRVLNQLYAQLPSIQCKGLCHEACSFIPCYPIEIVNLERLSSHPVPLSDLEVPDGSVMIAHHNTQCHFLVLGRCSVYDARPMICRMFGTVDGLQCPFGCVPDRLLSDADAMAIKAKIQKL